MGWEYGTNEDTIKSHVSTHASLEELTFTLTITEIPYAFCYWSYSDCSDISTLYTYSKSISGPNAVYGPTDTYYSLFYDPVLHSLPKKLYDSK